MGTRTSLILFGLLSGAAIAMMAGAQAAAPSVALYDVVDLGVIGGGDRTGAAALDDSGQIAGQGNVEAGSACFKPFRYSRSGGVALLGGVADCGVATGINGAGQIALYGYREWPEMRALRYTEGVGVEELGVPGVSSAATDINDLGQVAGHYRDGDGVQRAFRFTDGVGVQALGTLGGNSGATAIGGGGEVVGWSHTADGQTHAFLFTDQEGLLDLNLRVDPTSGWMLQEASAITGRHVVGRGYLNGMVRAFRLSNRELTDLGVLPAYTASWAVDVNSAGDAVGYCYRDSHGESDDTRAFIYSDRHGLKDLNELIDPAAGWTLTYAAAMNDRGQIVGTGTLGGQRHGFLLQPRTVRATRVLPQQ